MKWELIDPEGHPPDETGGPQPKTTATPDGRVDLIVGKDANTDYQALARLLVEQNETRPRFFATAKRDGVLFRPGPDHPPQPMGAEELATLSGSGIRYMEEGPKGKRRPCYPPVRLINGAIKLLRFRLPALTGVARTPFVHDGALITAPGFHFPTGRYLMPLPDGVRFDLTPDECVSRVDEWFNEFPWGDAGSRANAYSLLFGAPLKTLGIAPGLLVTKPLPQTGATKLVESISAVLDGERTIPFTPGEDTAELDKRIIAWVDESASSVMCVDNLERLESNLLSSGMASKTIGGRVLGTSRSASVSTSSITIALTGNNPQIKPDLLARVLHVRLDAQTDRPELRTGFRHRLPDDVEREREFLLSAVCSGAQRWIDSGMPEGQPVKLGTYDTYMTAVAGLLDVLGIKGYNANRETLVNGAADELTQFITAWLDRNGGGPLTLGELAPMMEILGVGTPGKPPNGRSVGQKLRRLKGVPASVAGVVWTVATAGEGTWKLDRKDQFDRAD